jgi:two-component system phosphate regulon response regulator PhoB
MSTGDSSFLAALKISAGHEAIDIPYYFSRVTPSMNESVFIVANRSIETRRIAQELKEIGIRTQMLANGRSTLASLTEQCPAVIVIDNALPDVSAVDLCRLVKSEARTRSAFVLLLLDDLNDPREAFESGAADCVRKPFNVRQLVLQIRNLLSSLSDSVKRAEIKVGDLSLDRSRHEVRAANNLITCTPTEFVLLSILMERSGRVQTREQLLNELWEFDSEIGPRVIDRHVCFLRAKLGPLGRYIKTVPSAGYRLVAA